MSRILFHYLGARANLAGRGWKCVPLYFITFVLLLPPVCVYMNLQHSPYQKVYKWLRRQLSDASPDDSTGKAFQQLFTDNDKRISEAMQSLYVHYEALLRTNNTEDGGLSNKVDSNRSSVYVSIAIISSERRIEIGEQLHFPRYLTQSVAKFLEAIKQSEHAGTTVNYDLSVCSVGTQMTEEEAYLKRLVPVFRREDAAAPRSVTFGPYHDRLAWPYEKEKRDYSFCLQKMRKLHNQDYLLMVEDDAIPIDGALRSLTQWIRNRKTNHRHSARPSYLKLYHPRRLQGFWSLEPERILQLLGVSAVLGTAIKFMIDRLAVPEKLDGTSACLWGTWLKCFLYSGLVAAAIGRPHLENLRTFFSPHLNYVVRDPYCCTQAVLYTVATADDLSQYLNTVNCNETFHKDDALWNYNYVRLDGRGRLLQPNQFRHVGLWSSLRSGFVDPQLILE